MAELGEVDKVPAHHVGEVGHSWREDCLHPEASDLFVKVAGCFDLETRHFHIHHFVLKRENEEKFKCITCNVVIRALIVSVVKFASIKWMPGSKESGRIRNIDILKQLIQCNREHVFCLRI